ncbi:unnamed protein product (macronuclear) [Paramecium tetraurelia]|uniref:Uncharacterized protein n=1 Tax=Paramecium tetraurelia TaxID=5888 RepID=A0CF32_PARTE|nr:uncharacterized protein GSPATT00037838001 [Paramecium tetraurelia]CAK69399.1 unnamed protein product [Paramecium tetraurelia]|eukprot:XP_001436796.1 hypothetical protein (macronuclear) [Paramecium tetraurelia strain d4-2]
MGCMNASGYISGPIEPFHQSNKSNFEAFLIEQLTLLGFQESQIVISKTIEIKFIPYLKELQTSIQQDIHSPFNNNIYLIPVLTNQLREIYIKTSEFLIRFQDYKLNTLINKVGLKYQALLRVGDLFPKQLNLRFYNNQISKIQIDPNITIIVINQMDIGYSLLQFIRELNNTFLLVFRQDDNDNSNINLFIETNSFQSCSVIVGVDDKEDRYNTIINLYTKVIKKQKKNQNSDSHSRILTQFLNQEDQEQFWDDGTLIFNFLNSTQTHISNNTSIITLQNHKIQSINEFNIKDLQFQSQKSLQDKKHIDQHIYKSIKQIMIKELIQALQLKSSQFSQYFKLKLSTQKIYKDLKLQQKIYMPSQLKLQNANEIESKTQEILTIIKKASYDTLVIKQSSKFQLPSKVRIYQILQQIFKDQDVSQVQIIINSILHIQWSLGDEIVNSQFNIQNQNYQNYKYKWKMIKFYDNFKITNLAQPKKQQIFFQAHQLLKCLTKKADLDIVNKIINQIMLDKWSVNEEYSPICDVYQISFINSTSVDETSQCQEKLDKIVVSQENQYLMIFLMDYQDPQKMSQLDQIISLPLQMDIKLIILSSSEFDNDNFEQLLNKKKIEKRIYQKNIQFWFPISSQINEIHFSQYLEIFYNLNSKENVIIINNKNQLCHKITGFHLITMLQERNYSEDDKKYHYNNTGKNQQKTQNNNEQLKKARQQLKQHIEKEIKQQQQLSLQNEQDHSTNMVLDFQWAKEKTINLDGQQKVSVISKQYQKPIFNNNSGIQFEIFQQIISNKQYDFQ